MSQEIFVVLQNKKKKRSNQQGNLNHVGILLLSAANLEKAFIDVFIESMSFLSAWFSLEDLKS